MVQTICRWGILGTADIARKNWLAIRNAENCTLNMEDRRRHVAVREYSNSAPSSQEANMFRTFAASALSGKPDESWGVMALKTQQVLDDCLHSARADG